MTNRASAPDQLALLRDICLALPETTERLSHGSPTWFVQGKRTFATYADYHHGARLGFWCAAPPGIQEPLIESAPDRFFRPPYVGRRGWIGVFLDIPTDWGEIRDLITDAYCQVAPPRLVVKIVSDTPPRISH